MVPHLDNTQTEHGFVSPLPLSNGMLGAIWLDGRNMKTMKDQHEEDKPLPVNMTLRYAAIDAQEIFLTKLNWMNASVSAVKHLPRLQALVSSPSIVIVPG